MCLGTYRLFLVRWAWGIWSDLLPPVFLIVLTLPTSAGTEKTHWPVPTFSLIIGDPWSQTGITASFQNSHAYRHCVPSWRSFMIVRDYHPKHSLYCDSAMKRQDLAFSEFPPRSAFLTALRQFLKGWCFHPWVFSTVMSSISISQSPYAWWTSGKTKLSLSFCSRSLKDYWRMSEILSR